MDSLAVRAPDVAAQWHPTTHGATTPQDVTPNSNVKYWFKCDVAPDHEWEAPLNNRVAGGQGCPCCSGRKVSVTNSLATVAPAVAAQWHTTKNGATTPADVTANTKNKFWFKCDVAPDHEWEASLGSRVNGGTGCPCCANRKPSITNSLEGLKPAAAAMWDHEANSPLTPSDVIAGSAKVYAFVDAEGKRFNSPLTKLKH
jgi:hypothetical protein